MALISIFLIVIVIAYMLGESSSAPSSTSKEKEEEKDRIHRNAPNKIKCKCLECNQVVMVPRQYLRDLTYYGPQTAKCPNCDWKLRKVKIIQTWGLDK